PAAAPEETSKSAVPRRIARAPALMVVPLAVESLRRVSVAPAVASIAETVLFHLEKSTSDTPEVEVAVPRAGTAQSGPEQATSNTSEIEVAAPRAGAAQSGPEQATSNTPEIEVAAPRAGAALSGPEQ